MSSLAVSAVHQDTRASTGTFDVRLRCIRPNELTAHLLGELDLATAELLTAVLRNHPASRVVRLDLAGLTFVDGAGLRAIETVRDRLRMRGGRVEVVHARAGVRRVMQLTGLDHLLSDSEEGSSECAAGPS